MNNRLKRLMSDTDIPDVDLKIGADGIKSRVIAAMKADLPERRYYMRYKILKTTAIAACVAVVGISTVFAASPEGREVISSIISYFQNEKATEMTSLEELAKYNEEIGASMTKDGKTLTLDSVAADDNFVHVFYTITSDTPFYTGDDPLAQGAVVAENQMCVECVIDGRLAIDYYNSVDGYFVDPYTYKSAYKFNVSTGTIPEIFKLEIYMGNYDSAAMLKLYQDTADEITDEDMTDVWYVSADVDKSAVKVETLTKDINMTLAPGVKINKAVFSPFGNQLVVSTNEDNDDSGLAYKVFGGFALYDENGTSLDILNKGLFWNSDGISTNAFEFLKADINTKQLKIVPLKPKPHDGDWNHNVIERKIGKYPIRYEMSSGYGSVVVTDVRFSDGVIAIDYYKDGFLLGDPGFDLLNDAGENAEPGGKLGCVLYNDVHYETNSYTARYVYDAWDENGNRIPADESVSADTLRTNFTTLGVSDTDYVKLDFDNAIIVDLK
ncbi:MAG: DUF4179 domain-containing protein [Oscillospiraceae bacterium]|nr:DUF4179 domain-containing protein [Oscillospiraceae bacterium]